MVFTNNCSSQNNKKPVDRFAVVAGQFYPSNKSELEKQLNELFSKAEKKSCNNVLALISPHAGYVFSGIVAASAFSQIDGGKKYEHIFIISSSHRAFFEGASIYCDGDYIIPTGKVRVDTVFCRQLVKNNKVFTSDPSSHFPEHSIEVQLPFLQYIMKTDFSIVPIIIGTDNTKICEDIGIALKPYFNEKNLFIISSDFSHYPAYKDAVVVDKNTADAICSGNPDALLKTLKQNSHLGIKNLSTSLCGWTSVLTLLYMTEGSKNIEYKIIKYLNSGDTPVYGDSSKVVGYNAIAVSEKKVENDEFVLSDQDKSDLLKIARSSIEEYVKNHKIKTIDSSEFSFNIKSKCGAFVSLHKSGKLRGCIGRFAADKSLYLIVNDMAIAAANEDSRFSPVVESELKSIDIEISVLTPLKKISDTSEIEMGKHGIYIMKNGIGGTFLPQVATETGWSKEEFLGHCSQEKAGLGWNGWKTADIYIYSAIVFGEESK